MVRCDGGYERRRLLESCRLYGQPQCSGDPRTLYFLNRLVERAKLSGVQGHAVILTCFQRAAGYVRRLPSGPTDGSICLPEEQLRDGTHAKGRVSPYPVSCTQIMSG